MKKEKKTESISQKDGLMKKLGDIDKKKACIIGGSIMGMLLVIYVGCSVFFMSHFYPGTSINGAKASGSTVQAVKKSILKEADEYKLTINGQGNDKVTISQADVDLNIDVESGMVEKVLDKQSGWGWVGALFSKKTYNSDSIVAYDKDKLSGLVNEMSFVTKTDTTATENAKPEYKDGKFVAQEEVYGDTIDLEAFKSVLDEALLTLDDKVDLDEDKCYVQPEVTADSEELKDLLDEMNEVLDLNVTYSVGSATETVPVDEVASWIITSDSKSISFDEDAMTEYIQSMGEKYNTFGQSKSLTTATGANVTVPGGAYGWKIDVAGEVEQLKSDLSSGNWTNRDFVYKYTAASHDGNDYGNSYVEVNLTAQHVYLIVNGSCVFDTACVTGKPSNGHATPAGAYGITYCERNAVLRGPGYATEVAYWMPFNGDIGLHDATWQSSFGGNRYLTHGSHGCVNLPLSAAQTIYGYVEAGFPVLCYNLGGSETEAVAEENETSDEDAANAVKEKISAIGDVTADSGDAISSARAAYNALSDSAKALVSNIDALNAAEASYNAISAEQEAQDAANAEAELQAEANSIMGQLASAGDEGGLAAAQAAYEAASDDVKARCGDFAGQMAAKRAELGL